MATTTSETQQPDDNSAEQTARKKRAARVSADEQARRDAEADIAAEPDETGHADEQEKAEDKTDTEPPRLQLIGQKDRELEDLKRRALIVQESWSEDQRKAGEAVQEESLLPLADDIPLPHMVFNSKEGRWQHAHLYCGTTQQDADVRCPVCQLRRVTLEDGRVKDLYLNTIVWNAPERKSNLPAGQTARQRTSKPNAAQQATAAEQAKREAARALLRKVIEEANADKIAARKELEPQIAAARAAYEELLQDPAIVAAKARLDELEAQDKEVRVQLDEVYAAIDALMTPPAAAAPARRAVVSTPVKTDAVSTPAASTAPAANGEENGTKRPLNKALLFHRAWTKRFGFKSSFPQPPLTRVCRENGIDQDVQSEENLDRAYEAMKAAGEIE